MAVVRLMLLMELQQTEAQKLPQMTLDLLLMKDQLRVLQQTEVADDAI